MFWNGRGVLQEQRQGCDRCSIDDRFFGRSDVDAFANTGSGLTRTSLAVDIVQRVGSGQIADGKPAAMWCAPQDLHCVDGLSPFILPRHAWDERKANR